jgi:uncharacterized protein YjlB
MKEEIKKFVEDLTRVAKPNARDIVLRKRKPHRFWFRDDGVTPNNPRYPLLVYRGPVGLDPKYDPAAILEVLFGKNRWGDSWRYTMYGYNHFHTGTHECLGIARGNLLAQFGGKKGRRIKLNAGDVVIIPAGVGHKHIRQSKDLLIVGCYPANAGDYDEPRPNEVEHQEALADIKRVERPSTDPVYGRNGPLLTAWRN